MRARYSVMGMLAFGVLLGACGKKKEPETPTPPPVTTPTTTETRDTAAERIAREREATAEAARRASAATAEARNTLLEMVFFDYDLADIRSDMQDVLNRKAALMRANPNVTLRIDGHADERGTVEYNLALSLRRANSVREYLTGFGIDVTRLEVRAFGEEQPLEAGTTEEAYARNRRAEFQITRGGDNLVLAR